MSLSVDSVAAGAVVRPSNYLEMRAMMRRIVQDMKSGGVVDPSNESVMREYSRRMRAMRGG